VNLNHSPRFSIPGRAILFVALGVFGVGQFLLTRNASASIITQSAFSANDNVITFETGSTALPNIPGLSFGLAPQDAGDATFANIRVNTFGNQFFGNLSGSFTEGYSYLAIAFSTPQPAVGAYILKQFSGQPTSLISTVYDSHGAPIESATTPFAAFDVPASQLPFVGLYEPSGISKIVWSFPTGQAGYYGVDNVIYGSAVPEPPSLFLALCAIAMCLLSFARPTECGRMRLKSLRASPL
jgi:hypothetical protein